MSALRPALIEIVAIGDELLLGQTVDTNASWLSNELALHGIRVTRRATVGDDAIAIREAVGEALERTGGVICTGGLGPTRDDLTRPVVAEMFGRALRTDDAVLRAIEARFARIGREMSPSNRCQADVPEGATVLPNANGTAPGLILVDGERFVILLPGVPREMRGLFADGVLPWLLERWPGRTGPIAHRRIRTTGIAESRLAELLEPAFQDVSDIGIAFLPDAAAGVDIRLTSWGVLPEDQAAAEFDRIEARVRAVAGQWIYASGDGDLVDAVAEALASERLTVAVAESCTGGLIAKRLTDRAGSSEYMLGGVVAYANGVKTDALGVPAALIAEHGAVSEAVAESMARGVAQRMGADCSIAVTGIAGPGGGTDTKPVGTVCVAARVRDRARVVTTRFPGDRAEVRERSAQFALALLWKLLQEVGG